jgi:hypothetical protein
MLAWLAPTFARAGEDENWQRLRSMPPEQRQVLAENLKKFDALDRNQKAAIRELDERIAKLPAENRMNYDSVLRRYHLWVQSLPREQQDALRATPPGERMALVRKLRAEGRSTSQMTTPSFLEIADLNAPSPFDAASRLKIWFELPPEQRAEVEWMPPVERRDRLTELGKKAKVTPTHRLSKAEEDDLLKRFQSNPLLKERMNRVGEAKKDEAARRRIADHFYFIENPPEEVAPENLMRFDAALPSWYRSAFDHLPPEEATRRLTILYRLVYPAPKEMPADFKPTASAASPAPVSPAKAKSKAPVAAPKPASGLAPTTPGAPSSGPQRGRTM